VLGFETETAGRQCGVSDYVGWHISGTCGVFGSAAATGKLMGPHVQPMVWALGLAASQPVGLRESFRSIKQAQQMIAV
jgi:2-methylcitrate dehydratase PrpD